MYRSIRINCVQQGARILNPIRGPVTDDIRASNHRELQMYKTTTVSKVLKRYISVVEYSHAFATCAYPD